MEMELEELTVEELLNRITNDDSLRQAFISRLSRVTGSNDDSPAVHVSTSANSLQATGSYQSGIYTSSPLDSSTHQFTTSLVAGAHQLENANDPLAAGAHQLGDANDPLAAGAHQSGSASNPLAARTHQMGSTSNPLAAGVHQLVNIGNSPLAAGVHQSGANISDSLAADEQPGINDARDPHEGHQLESASIPPDFDPTSAALEDEYTFSAQSTITSYIEKHFRRTLDKASRTAMHKAHPIPKTEATKAPKVDRFMQDYLASRFPKSEDSDLARIQTAMLRASGPMTCLWAEMIDNGLLGDPEATINVHDVLNIIQRSLVLLGNANEMISQLRRSRLLQLVDKSLQKYAQEPRPDSGECLFGVDFTKHLKGQVETDTSLAQVVSMSHRFHPYKNGRQPAITGTKQQFFRGGPARKWGPRQGNPHTPSHYQPRGQSAYRGKGANHRFTTPSKRF